MSAWDYTVVLQLQGSVEADDAPAAETAALAHARDTLHWGSAHWAIADVEVEPSTSTARKEG